MVSFKSLLTFSVKGLASFAAISSCWTPEVAAAALPERSAHESPDLVARHQQMAAELGPRLSLGGLIYFVGSEVFETLTERWQLFAPPKFIAVVDARTERDVQYAVQFANLFGLPYLAVSGHHGGISTLGNMKYGIQISMERLNGVQVNPDGKTATIGGGALSKHITDSLWAKGKQTVTGACECTSLMGPMLGGGHGWLQGRYGLLADQLVEARMVLSNGQAVTVSDKSYKDLFWAIKGAGHNFGIVTQVKYKVYDVPNGGKWTYANLIFKQDKLEKVFDMNNKITNKGKGPVEYIDFIWYLRVPTIDAQKPVVSLYMLYQGDRKQAQKYIDMYKALGPANTSIIDTDYTQISALSGNGNDGIACAHGQYSAMRFPTGFVEMNTKTTRKLFDKFADITIKQPAFNNSFYLFESYSTKGVQSVDSGSSAFPDRFNNHLTTPVLVYFDSKLDKEAIKAGQDLRKIALDGKPGGLNAYVNYAHGDEQMEDWYGHESWRIQRLQSLKRKYDPRNKFSFYAPITQGRRGY